MNKIGVLQLIDSLNAGGAEVLAVNISNGLAKYSNINSFIGVTRKEGILKENLSNNVNYIFLEKKRTLDVKAILKVRKLIKKHNIQIIHAHSSSYFFAVLVKLSFFRIKIIWHDHYGKSQSLHKRSLFPLVICSLFFNHIISVNTSLKNWAKSKLFCKNVSFINNYPSLKNTNKTTILKGLPQKRIVNLAGFRAQKDHISLIDGFFKFHKNNPQWTLHLIGKLYNDNYSDSIQKKIEALNLDNAVFIYGECLDIKNILEQSSIGILSSKSEGLPVSLLEYGLAKLPVIVTNVGECGSVVENNNSGLVIEKQNSDQICEALTTFALSEEKKSSFALKHNKIVTENYSEKIFFKRLLDIYSIDSIS